MIFSLTDALGFERVDLRLAGDIEPPLPARSPSDSMLLNVGDIRDICHLHEFSA